MKERTRQGATSRGLAAGLGEFCAVFTFTSGRSGQTPTLPTATYAVMEPLGGEAAAAKLSRASFIPAIAGPPFFGPPVRRTRLLRGR